MQKETEESFFKFEREENIPLSKVTDKFLSKLRGMDLTETLNEIPNEFFDKNIRPELWLDCISMVENATEEKKKSKIREIVNVDKVRQILIFGTFIIINCINWLASCCLTSI